MQTKQSKGSKMFQSTRPRGARRKCPVSTVWVSSVSIHAPARGATGVEPETATDDWSFNPRAREGRDTLARKYRCAAGRFNPRAREGRDFGKRNIR